MDKTVQKKKKPSDDGILFETFAIEEWFWIKVDGQIQVWPNYVTLEDATYKFKMWKKKREDAQKK